jgi:hypothetical protein
VERKTVIFIYIFFEMYGEKEMNVEGKNPQRKKKERES